MTFRGPFCQIVRRGTPLREPRKDTALLYKNNPTTYPLPSARHRDERPLANLNLDKFNPCYVESDRSEDETTNL